MARPTLLLDSVVKVISGRSVLGPLTLEVRRGELHAILGPNGAGKTTLMRIAAGVYEATSGRVEVEGVHPRLAAARGVVAYLPEEAGVYPKLTGWEHLKLLAKLYGRSSGYLEEAARLSGLGGRLGERVEAYSRGMRRRLLLAAVLALRTPLVLLDEPLSGVDPAWRSRMLEAIRATTSSSAVVVATHDLEVARLADYVHVLVNGRIVASGSPGEVLPRLSELLSSLLGWSR